MRCGSIPATLHALTCANEILRTREVRRQRRLPRTVRNRLGRNRTPPIAAITDEPWDRLTIHQESEVFKLLAELALDVAPFTLPDNVEEFLEE